MISPANNPFANPELLHPELAADIAATEAWQAENLVLDVELAAGGLAKTLEAGTALATPEWVKPELVEIYEAITSQAETSCAAANKLVSDLNAIPERPDIVEAVDERIFAQTLQRQLKEWHDNGSLLWAKEYIDSEASSWRDPCKLTLVTLPKTRVNGPEFLELAKSFAGERIAPQTNDPYFWAAYRDTDLTAQPRRYNIESENTGEALDIVLMPTIGQFFVRPYEADNYLKKVQTSQGNVSRPTVYEAMGYQYALIEADYIHGDGLDYSVSAVESFEPSMTRNSRSISLNFTQGYLCMFPTRSEHAKAGVRPTIK